MTTASRASSLLQEAAGEAAGQGLIHRGAWGGALICPCVGEEDRSACLLSTCCPCAALGLTYRKGASSPPPPTCLILHGHLLQQWAGSTSFSRALAGRARSASCTRRHVCVSPCRPGAGARRPRLPASSARGRVSVLAGMENPLPPRASPLPCVARFQRARRNRVCGRQSRPQLTRPPPRASRRVAAFNLPGWSVPVHAVVYFFCMSAMWIAAGVRPRPPRRLAADASPHITSSAPHLQLRSTAAARSCADPTSRCCRPGYPQWTWTR